MLSSRRAQKRSCNPLIRPRILRTPGEDNVTLFKHRDRVRYPDGKVEVMLDKQHTVSIVCQISDSASQEFSLGTGQPRCWFIQ
jgi:hypothetical protein